MQTDAPNISFDCKRFLHNRFKNPAGVVAFMQSYGVQRLNTAEVAKWFQRNQIPAKWLPLMLGFLEVDTGGPVSLAEYLGRTVVHECT